MSCVSSREELALQGTQAWSSGWRGHYWAKWRVRNPNYMKIKGREWRARRKAQRLAIAKHNSKQQIVEGQQQ